MRDQKVVENVVQAPGKLDGNAWQNIFVMYQALEICRLQQFAKLSQSSHLLGHKWPSPANDAQIPEERPRIYRVKSDDDFDLAYIDYFLEYGRECSRMACRF